MGSLARFPGPQTQEGLELSRIDPDRYYFGQPLVKGLTPLRKISGADLLGLAALGHIQITDYQLMEMFTVASVTDMMQVISGTPTHVSTFPKRKRGVR